VSVWATGVGERLADHHIPGIFAAIREQPVRVKNMTPFRRFVIRLASAPGTTWMRPASSGRFSDQAGQFTDARGRWSWIAYRAYRPSSLRAAADPAGRFAKLYPDRKATVLRCLPDLRGKPLACWCPLCYPAGSRCPCHAGVLLELANR
jgi:hypothetical protein